MRSKLLTQRWVQFLYLLFFFSLAFSLRATLEVIVVVLYYPQYNQDEKISPSFPFLDPYRNVVRNSIISDLKWLITKARRKTRPSPPRRPTVRGNLKFVNEISTHQRFVNILHAHVIQRAIGLSPRPLPTGFSILCRCFHVFPSKRRQKYDLLTWYQKLCSFAAIGSVRRQTSDIQGQDELAHQRRHQGHQVLQTRRTKCGEIHPESKYEFFFASDAKIDHYPTFYSTIINEFPVAVQAGIQSSGSLRHRLHREAISSSIHRRKGRVCATFCQKHANDVPQPFKMSSRG